jgi:hypothetical protein
VQSDNFFTEETDEPNQQYKFKVKAGRPNFEKTSEMREKSDKPRMHLKL